MESIETPASAVVRIAREFNADVLLLFTETGRNYRPIRKLASVGRPRLIVATLSPRTFEDLKSEGFSVLMVPSRIKNRIARIQHALGESLARGMISPGEMLICWMDANPGTDVGTVLVHRATGSESGATLFLGSDPVKAVVELAIQMGREGVEGRPVGTSFTVGDWGKVMELSHQIGINPFKGHSISVLDRENWYLIKRYAMPCEGAFVVDSDGTILAADRYLRAENVEIDIPSGLGTRHRAIARITAVTNAVGVVVSEGDREVRIFRGGRLIETIDPLSGI